MTSLAHPTATLGRVFEHRLLQYRRTYRASLFSSFAMPVLFLTAMGVGLGTYVDGGTGGSALGGVSYLAFLAPGLLASAAMQSAAFESTFPIMGGLVWNKTFHAMHATPISGRDVTLGNLLWVATRLTLIATVFTVVIVLFGAATSPLVVLAIPAAVLTGMAFAAPIAAFSATQRTPENFNAIFRFGITPLYHGVELTRDLTLGTITDEPLLALVHVAILLGFIAVGTVLAVRTISARLVRG